LHELVQPAHFGHQIGARPQVQVVGVREHQAGTDFLELGRRYGLDGGLRAHRRENGRGNIAVRRVKNAGAGAAVAGEQIKLEGLGCVQVNESTLFGVARCLFNASREL
jgi:hypothetical protein